MKLLIFPYVSLYSNGEKTKVANEFAKFKKKYKVDKKS